jgi:hypothetical protein
MSLENGETLAWILISLPRQTNVRLAKYVGWNVLQHTSNSGGTIPKALDFLINTDPGDEGTSELYPNVAAVGAIYGDPNGKYASFLVGTDETYPADPHFLWNQPLSDNGWVSRNPDYGGKIESGNNNANGDGGNRTTGNGIGGGGSKTGENGSARVVVGTISLATLSVLVAWLLA